jgi:hypothetical protein
MTSKPNFVEALPRQADGSIEIRRATFADDAEKILSDTRTRSSLIVLLRAIRDPRVDRSGLRVLANISEKISHATGTAFPSRKLIAEEEGLGEKVVQNTLYALRSISYLDWQRIAAPEVHPGRLIHYTFPIARYSEEDIAAALHAWCQQNEEELPPYFRDKLPGRPGTLPAVSGRTTTCQVGQLPLDTTHQGGQTTCQSGYKATRQGGQTTWLGGNSNKDNSLSKKERETRLPADWQPSRSDRDYARGKGLTESQIDWLADGFRDYWHSGNAKGQGLKVDWPATWRTNVREAIARDRLPKNMNGSGGYREGRL